MVNWKSENNLGSIWTMKIAGIELSVHTYIGMGNCWFATSKSLGLDGADLKTEDLEMAKVGAIKLVEKHLKDKIELYQFVLEEIGEEG